jgi:hypothetical protein
MPPLADAAPEGAAREPKVRRISNKPPRKSAEPEPSAKDPAHTAVPETEADPKTDQKRSRRRRGKDKPGRKEPETPFAQESPLVEETIAPAPETPQPRPPARKQQPEARDKAQEHRPQPHNPRRKPDPGKVAKNAWKIFLAEVGEEGVALIGDNDARELARRCFRLSEIFLEEEGKRG